MTLPDLLVAAAFWVVGALVLALLVGRIIAVSERSNDLTAD